MYPSPQNEEVLVQDIEFKFLAPTTRANARRLLKEAEARIVSYTPFTIQLLKLVPNINHLKRSLNGGSKMRVSNFHDFFSTPKAIFVQNISNPVGVISLSFKKANGDVSFCKLPANRNPVILTNIINFDDIKGNGAFLKFLQPSSTGPARLQLLSEEEFNSFYEQKAEDYGVATIDEAIEEAQFKAQAFNSGLPVQDQFAPRIPAGTAPEVIPVKTNTVNPKVVAICQQLHPSSVPLMSTKDAMDTFNAMDLDLLDYRYIVSNCYDAENPNNALLGKWATKRLGGIPEVSDGIIREPKKAGRPKAVK